LFKACHYINGLVQLSSSCNFRPVRHNTALPANSHSVVYGLIQMAMKSRLVQSPIFAKRWIRNTIFCCIIRRFVDFRNEKYYRVCANWTWDYLFRRNWI